MFPNKAKWISGAAGVVLIAFFMPWLLVSCGEQPVAQLSGWDLATGKQAQQVPTNVEFFLVPFGAAVVLYLAYRAYTDQSKWARAALGSIVVGAVNLLELLYLLIGANARLQSQQAGQMVSIRAEFGWIVELVAGAILVIAGLGLRQDSKEGELASAALPSSLSAPPGS